MKYAKGEILSAYQRLTKVSNMEMHTGLKKQ